MILDLIVFFILLFFMFLGFKNGFVHTLFNSFGWIISIIVAVIFNDEFGNFLKSKTSIYDNLFDYVLGVTKSYVEVNLPGTSNLPSIIGSGIDQLTQAAAVEAAVKITDAVFVILSFFVLFILVKLAFFILSLILSKKFHKGFVGGIDGLFGSLLGILQGAATVLIILAVIVPASLLINTDWYQWVSTSLDNSIITGTIYENNPLRVIVEGYIPAEFMPDNMRSIDEIVLPNLEDMI